MEEDIKMNGDWYIPKTNETIAEHYKLIKYKGDFVTINESGI